MHETKCEQQKAKLYLREFNNNFEKALEKYRERQIIIIDFAKKQGIDYQQA